MMMYKKYSFLSLYFLLFSITLSFAQTAEEREKIISHYDLQKLYELQQQFDGEFKADKERALRLAAIYGWKETIDLPNGGISTLVGVYGEDTPIYYQTDNRGAGITARTDRVHSGGSAGLNLNGENMVGGIWDGGRVRASHILLENRANQVDSPGGYSNHATHVAGTMIGTETVQNGVARGMAPEATLVAYDYSNDESEMVAAAANGLLVSNHSYGIVIDFLPLWRLGYYDTRARNLDYIAYTAPYYLPVCSAGNDRNSGKNLGDNGYDYLTDKSVSKNSIVVAAVYQVNNYSGPNSVVMSNFSSWGPTDDGRIKPDISGKGVNTYSSTASSNSSFSSLNGTSMATPNISGSLLLLQQHYNSLQGSYMRSATLRGLALHTADEAGAHPGPDYRFGWGLMNTEKAAEVITNNGNTSVIIEEELAQDEVYTFSVQADGINDLVASITWTDPAGTSPQSGINDLNTPMLVNDLDLRVSQDGGNTFFPWKLNPENPSAAATEGDNIVDNIEKIEIPNASGEYIIRVSHKNTLASGSQAFSLIVTGIEREDFTVSTHQGYQGFCPGPNSVTYNIDLGFTDGFTDSIDFTVSDVPSGANATLVPNLMATEGTVALTLDNLNLVSPGYYQMKVTATGTFETVNLYPVLHIIDPQLAPVSLVSPVDGAIAQPIDITFNWDILDAGEYDFQLALDAGFSSLITDITIPDTQTTVEGLLNDTTYYWRVKARNLCGEGNFSNAYSFTTETFLNVGQEVFEELMIYPNPTTSVLNIEANGNLGSVSILNMLGQNIMTVRVDGPKIQINTDALQAGNYFIKINSGNKAAVKRFVKN